MGTNALMEPNNEDLIIMGIAQFICISYVIVNSINSSKRYIVLLCSFMYILFYFKYPTGNRTGGYSLSNIDYYPLINNIIATIGHT